MRSYLNKDTIDISRHSYVGGKSSYASLATNVKAYVRPLTEEQSAINDVQFGRGFFVMVLDSIDVQEGDQITFNSVVHTVQGVSRHTRGFSIPKFKQALMIKPQEN